LDRFITAVFKLVDILSKNSKMSSGALFGNTGGRSQSKNLVEFRAGKMTMKGRTVYPDKRKGMVYIYQSDDSLMHFCWRERSKSTAEDVISHIYLTYLFESSDSWSINGYIMLRGKEDGLKMAFIVSHFQMAIKGAL